MFFLLLDHRYIECHAVDCVLTVWVYESFAPTLSDRRRRGARFGSAAQRLLLFSGGGVIKSLAAAVFGGANGLFWILSIKTDLS
jgi:hypothetical protein